MKKIDDEMVGRCPRFTVVWSGVLVTAGREEATGATAIKSTGADGLRIGREDGPPMNLDAPGGDQKEVVVDTASHVGICSKDGLTLFFCFV